MDVCLNAVQNFAIAVVWRIGAWWQAVPTLSPSLYQVGQDAPIRVNKESGAFKQENWCLFAGQFSEARCSLHGSDQFPRHSQNGTPFPGVRSHVLPPSAFAVALFVLLLSSQPEQRPGHRPLTSHAESRTSFPKSLVDRLINRRIVRSHFLVVGRRCWFRVRKSTFHAPWTNTRT